MSARAAAIALRIPDNEAYTALVTLRRLDVPVARVERSIVVSFEDGIPAEAAVARIRADESLFNPNKHRIVLLEDGRPRSGEVWIRALGGGRCVAWRLFDEREAPVSRVILDRAVERLLCNPAIESASCGAP